MISNFLKAVFHKFYLIHSWILCLIYMVLPWILSKDREERQWTHCSRQAKYLKLLWLEWVLNRQPLTKTHHSAKFTIKGSNCSKLFKLFKILFRDIEMMLFDFFPCRCFLLFWRDIERNQCHTLPWKVWLYQQHKMD